MPDDSTQRSRNQIVSPVLVLDGSVHPKRRAYLLGPLVMGEYLLCKLYPRQILEDDGHKKIHRFTRATFDGCNLRPSALMCG